MILLIVGFIGVFGAIIGALVALGFFLMGKDNDFDEHFKN